MNRSRIAPPFELPSNGHLPATLSFPLFLSSFGLFKMSVPDWFSNLIQTAEAAELHQYQETGATSTVQAQEEAVAEAVSNTGYEQPQQQQSPQSSSSHSG